MTEGINQYETVVIVTTKVGDEGNKAIVEKFKDLIAKHGTVESVDDWGKRRLAYPIQKQNEGYYTLINFASAPDFTAELDRRYQISEDVLRSLIIKKDPRHVKAETARKEKKAEEQSIDVEAIAVETIEASETSEATVEASAE